MFRQPKPETKAETLAMAVEFVGQTFLSAGFGGFPVAGTGSRGWKTPRTGRLESLPYAS